MPTTNKLFPIKSPSNGNKNEFPAEIPSGVPRMLPYMVAGFVVLTTVYYSLVYMFQGSVSILGLPPPADEYCVNNENESAVCARADLFAFQMVSWISLVYCGVLGVHTWHVTGRSHSTIPQTPEGRLFGYIPEGEKLAAACFTFQIFDFLISFVIPEHCTAVMLIHHAMAATAGWCSLQSQCLHHYGVYFLGLSEVSSIFLIFVDLAKYFPPEPGTLFDRFVGVFCAPPFAIFFTLYRVILWWPVSIQFFQDVYSVLKSGQASKLRPGKEWVLFVYLAINIPFGTLQLYWFTIVVEEARKALL